MNLLSQWGLDPFFYEQWQPAGERSYCLGRIVNEEKGGYKLITETGVKTAQLSGRYEFRCQDGEEPPTVGDWVLCFGDDLLMIDRLLERRSVLKRRRPGTGGKTQTIGANIDVVFIVTSCNLELSFERLERYVALVRSGGAKPVIVLSKSDLGDASLLKVRVQQRITQVDVCSVSAVNGEGKDSLQAFLGPGMTGAFVGSSGVGKSSLTNLLLEQCLQQIQGIQADDRGRHTTTSRSMFVIPMGGVLIDTPGMREVGMTDEQEGVDQTFFDLDELALHCRFSNCTHQNEPGCALLAAIEANTLEPARLKNWHKLQREQAWFERSKDARAMSQHRKKHHKTIAKQIRAMRKQEDS